MYEQIYACGKNTFVYLSTHTIIYYKYLETLSGWRQRLIYIYIYTYLHAQVNIKNTWRIFLIKYNVNTIIYLCVRLSVDVPEGYKRARSYTNYVQK